MDPNGPFEGRTLKKSQSLRQCLSKALGEETPQKKIWNGSKEEEGEKDIVKVVEHGIAGRLKCQMTNFKSNPKPKCQGEMRKNGIDGTLEY
jgi:hypothetical protein